MHSKIALFVSVCLALVLAGCTTDQTTIPSAPTVQPLATFQSTPQTTGPVDQAATASNPPGNAQTLADGTCASPFDGTWKGVIADSGSLKVSRVDSDGKMLPDTDNPFTAQYDFEMTIQCSFVGLDENGVESRQYTITHAKASHPIFNCADGCKPNGGGDLALNGTGNLGISFPNGAYVGFANEEGLQVSPDGKTITLYIPGGKWEGFTIGMSRDYTRDVETYNCKQYGGGAGCSIDYINPNTITLTKIA